MRMTVEVFQTVGVGARIVVVLTPRHEHADAQQSYEPHLLAYLGTAGPRPRFKTVVMLGWRVREMVDTILVVMVAVETSTVVTTLVTVEYSMIVDEIVRDEVSLTDTVEVWTFVIVRFFVTVAGWAILVEVRVRVRVLHVFVRRAIFCGMERIQSSRSDFDHQFVGAITSTSTVTCDGPVAGILLAGLGTSISARYGKESRSKYKKSRKMHCSDG